MTGNVSEHRRDFAVVFPGWVRHVAFNPRERSLRIGYLDEVGICGDGTGARTAFARGRKVRLSGAFL